MAKINRKDVQLAKEVAMQTGKSFAEFVLHCKKMHSYILGQLEAIDARLKALEPKEETPDA